MIKKRIIAYIIDMLIITFISSFIFTLPIFSNSQETYLNNYENYVKSYNEYINNKIDEKDIINAEYKMIKSSSSLLTIRVGVILLYFCIIPYYKKGQTIGKKITKIKVVSTNKKEINPGLFFLRGLISTMALIDIINLFILLISSKTTYQVSSIILNYSTYIFYIATIIYIIATKERKSLHDLITQTKVVESTQKQL